MPYPKRVTIELTNRCNRRCEGCPRAKMLYPEGDMSEDLFSKIITELPSSTTVVPFFRGEPLLHPQFPQLMNQLHKFNTVQLATNGDYLTKLNQKAILNNATFLSISLHELRYPNRTNYLPFLEDCKRGEVETQVSILETLIKESQLKQFERMWLRHVDRVRVYKEHSRNGFGSMNNEFTNTPCNKPFEDMVIYWNGNVGLCNHDWNNSTYLGNVRHDSIESIWNNISYRLTRDYHLNGRRRDVASCKTCDFQSNKVYGEIIIGE